MKQTQIGRQRPDMGREMGGHMLLATAPRPATSAYVRPVFVRPVFVRPALVTRSWHVSLIPAMPALGAGHKASPANGTCRLKDYPT